MRKLHPQAGATLLDAMLALAVMAFALLGHVGLQTVLQRQADLSRQHGEALRLAQGLLEQSRRFSVVDTTPGQRAWADLADLAEAELPADDGLAGYRAHRHVHHATMPGLKELVQRVTWPGRDGQPQHSTLRSAVAAVPPALSGALALGATGWPGARLAGRHAAIPLAARDLGDGRSVLQPTPDRAWIFDHASGDVVGTCEGLAAGMVIDAAVLARCARAVRAQYLGGHVRFGSGLEAEADDPRGRALNLDLVLALTSSGHPEQATECLDDAPATPAAAAGQTVVRFHCLVQANPAQRWSGRLDIAPRAWSDQAGPAWAMMAGTPGGWHACRYSAAAEGQSTPNTMHPARYIDVQGHLTHQNFLLLPSQRACPADATQAHQP
jgi:hypothetical protein